MKIEKLQISKEKSEINLKFYFLLKHLNKLNPSERQINLVSENISLFKSDIEKLRENLEIIFQKSLSKLEIIREISLRINDELDIILLNFSTKLFQIKDLLLAESKIFENIDLENLSKLDPLSLEYDKISVLKPYKTRVNGALLALLFFEKLDEKKFNFMSKDSFEYISHLSKIANDMRKKGLETNQIFMLMFNESINQSIISDSGTNYEDRIRSVLSNIGIKNISKTHDKNDKSTEYDFFFEIDNKTYGIGAKRTLRERYKQFIKTSLTSKIDISIQITLGIDLNEEKAKIILSHGSYIFVSDEVYQSRNFLQKYDKIYSVKNLNVKTLRNLK
ncbi:MAG: hypothetical protein EBT63_04170 [Proteobacteria bacterium]|nr:hypothetical protein [Pseudomonadota bacterium]NCA28474.1 hypothetical protein [Pseudomonadota bacterium]